MFFFPIFFSTDYQNNIQQDLVNSVNPDKNGRVKYLNMCDREGNTALHYACQRSKIETDKNSPNYPYNHPMILFLIVEGADPYSVNCQGTKPADLVEHVHVIRRAVAMRKEKLQEEEVRKLM